MKSLVSYLNRKTPQELSALAQTWQASLNERLVQGNTFQLSQEMQSEFLQRRLLEKLSEADQTLLQTFLARPDFTLDPADQPADFLPRLTALRLAGLVYEEQVRLEQDQSPPTPTAAEQPSGGPAGPNRPAGWQSIYRARNGPGAPAAVATKPVWLVPRELARPFARLVPEKQASDRQERLLAVPLSHLPLPELLKRLEPESLELQAETWGILSLLGQAEPEEVAKELAGALSDLTAQKRVLADLPPGSQELFEALKKRGRAVPLSELLEEYVSLRRLSRSLRPLIERLLAWELFEDGQSLVFVPAEIRQPHTTVAPKLPLQTVTPPADATVAPEYALAWDSLTFLGYLTRNEVVLTNDEHIPKRDLKKLATGLWPWPGEMANYRLDFLIDLSEYLRLYEVGEGGRLVAGSALADWLQLDLYGQMQRLVEAWLQNYWWNGLITFPYYYRGRDTINQANRTMLSWLAGCEPGQWYSLSALQEKVQRENPYFILPRPALLNQLGPQGLAEASRMWLHREGQLIYDTFQYSFEWLGLVRLGREGSERITAFAVTDFGAAMAGRSGASRPALLSEEPALLIQPNFEILLLAPRTEVLWMLPRFADLKKLDQVSIYQLTRESVLRGLQTGLSQTEMLDWLQTRSGQSLPQNLAVSLGDWSKGFKRVNVEEVTLLEVEDSAVLDELLRSKQYAEYFVRRLSPTAALVRLPDAPGNRRTNPLKTFKTKLRSGGFFAD